MIDLHSHVLPGIDDGPPDLAGSIALARTAADGGTTVLAATPHLRSDHPGVRLGELAGRCRALAERLASEGVQVEVVPGGEVDLLWGLDASDRDLQLASYRQAGSDVLLETPYSDLLPNFADLVMAIADRGFRVLLAHPERNPTFQRRPERLKELVRRGVLVQVTAASLVRTDRSRSRSLAAALVEEGVAHVIASDAHRAGELRTPELAAGRDAADRLAPGRGEWMVTEAPAAVLAGEPLPQAPAAASGGRGRWWRR